jgi:hypothetical protein
MGRRDHLRATAMMIATLAVTVGLASCGSSDADGPTVPPAPAATQPATTAAPAPATTAPTVTVPATTAAPATTVAPTTPATEVATTTAGVTVTDAEVADLEKQLDEIDQLLAGVDADLSQD